MDPLVPYISSWIRDYKSSTFRYDLVAAITVAVVSVPQGLAYARLASESW